MDSITQAALGAAVGEAVLGRKAGNKAVLWGAVCGTLPDLDVLATPLLTDVQRLVFHRGFSHSIVFALAMAPLLGHLLARLHKNDDGVTRKDWSLLVFWCIFTHPLLDCFTIYGTRLFWPFTDYAVALNTIFVIDPIYTIPLIGSSIAILFLARTSSARLRTNRWALILSSGYLLFTTVNKFYIEYCFRAALQQQGIRYERMLTNPTPLNNILWQAVVERDGEFLVGLYSLFDRSRDITFQRVHKSHDLLEPFEDDKEVRLLKRASKGYYAVAQENGFLIFNDLRFGHTGLGLKGEGDFVFSYRIETGGNPKAVSITRRIPRFNITGDLLGNFIDRILGTG